MINNKNKRLEITLTIEEYQLLTSISTRFNITKSQAIKQALRVFASKRKHYMTISYKEVNIEEEQTSGSKNHIQENTEQVSEKDWNKMFEEKAKFDFNDKNKDDEDLPF